MKALSSMHCDAIMLVNRGVILNVKDDIFNNHIVYTFLPQIPNVRIKFFQLQVYSYKPGCIETTTEYQEIISTINKTSISKHETSTCLILFSSRIGYITLVQWASAIQNSKDNEIDAVWGGAVTEMNSVKHIHDLSKSKTSKKTDLGQFESTLCHCVAILITGPIHTWSLVLKKECNTMEQVEVRLNLFKDQVKLKKHSIGFIIRGNCREIPMYNGNNVESTIFKRLFPEVPLAGCNGICQFGKNTIVDRINEEKNNKEERKSTQSWHNVGSTVFLILTYDVSEKRRGDKH